MKRLILTGAVGLAIAIVWPSLCQASFDFSVSNLSYDSNTGSGSLRVYVQPTGETVPASVALYSVPLQFKSYTGSISSVMINSLASVGSVPAPSLSLATITPPQSYAVNGVAYVTPTVAGSLVPFQLTSGLNPLFDVQIQVGVPGSFEVDVISSGGPGADLALFDGTTFAPLPVAVGGGTGTLLSAVPEPSSFLFMGLACVLGIGVRKFYRSRAAKAA